jgi:hypothetical protein
MYRKGHPEGMLTCKLVDRRSPHLLTRCSVKCNLHAGACGFAIAGSGHGGSGPAMGFIQGCQHAVVASRSAR